MCSFVFLYDHRPLLISYLKLKADQEFACETGECKNGESVWRFCRRHCKSLCRSQLLRWPHLSHVYSFANGPLGLRCRYQLRPQHLPSQTHRSGPKAESVTECYISCIGNALPFYSSLHWVSIKLFLSSIAKECLHSNEVCKSAFWPIPDWNGEPVFERWILTKKGP